MKQANCRKGRISAMEKLLNIMALLRDKKSGCPWDLEQTHQSLVKYTLEEVYEVVDAVENGTTAQLKDELGDLLFQVVFYAQIAEEDGEFDFNEIVDVISDKLVRRHPHVFPEGRIENFGQDQNLSAEDVVVNWEAIKGQEREANRAETSDHGVASILDGVPMTMPALERGLKLQKRAASVGFDWDNLNPVIDKLKEELSELENAIDHAGKDNDESVSDELGDLLFALLNVARHLKIEPENALRKANKKFETRFRYVEDQLIAQDSHPDDVGLEMLDRLWEQAKGLEKTRKE